MICKKILTNGNCRVFFGKALYLGIFVVFIEYLPFTDGIVWHEKKHIN